MDITLFPTKGNLMLAKKSLRLSKQGYTLLDKKRNVLIHEMMELIDRAKAVQSKIDKTFSDAYHALQAANVMFGINNIGRISYAVPLEEGIKIRFRSVMGVEIPIVNDETAEKELYTYGFHRTGSALDEAYTNFVKVKNLSLELAEIENSVYRLAANIKKTQKRANALKNIMIPRYESITASIQNALEEKEREEFTRLKVIKTMK
ncbi:MAG: V-type sodium ATPase subunit D [Firmicutes bacterium ADurb.Bin193]|nr:MAG: V-type sodium ATPase subunit D [Firmicutes bacterium ADurb.Bin193]